MWRQYDMVFGTPCSKNTGSPAAPIAWWISRAFQLGNHAVARRPHQGREAQVLENFRQDHGGLHVEQLAAAAGVDMIGPLKVATRRLVHPPGQADKNGKAAHVDPAHRRRHSRSRPFGLDNRIRVDGNRGIGRPLCGVVGC
jgi:hypothetical protein